MALGLWGIGTLAAIFCVGTGQPVRESVACPDRSNKASRTRKCSTSSRGRAAAGVPVPQLRFVLDPALNSYSVGRTPESAVVVLTTGLIEKLTRDETEAVLAYELSRITASTRLCPPGRPRSQDGRSSSTRRPTVYS